MHSAFKILLLILLSISLVKISLDFLLERNGKNILKLIIDSRNEEYVWKCFLIAFFVFGSIFVYVIFIPGNIKEVITICGSIGLIQIINSENLKKSILELVEYITYYVHISIISLLLVGAISLFIENYFSPNDFIGMYFSVFWFGISIVGCVALKQGIDFSKSLNPNKTNSLFLLCMIICIYILNQFYNQISPGANYTYNFSFYLIFILCIFLNSSEDKYIIIPYTLFFIVVAIIVNAILLKILIIFLTEITSNDAIVIILVSMVFLFAFFFEKGKVLFRKWFFINKN